MHSTTLMMFSSYVSFYFFPWEKNWNVLNSGFLFSIPSFLWGGKKGRKDKRNEKWERNLKVSCRFCFIWLSWFLYFSCRHSQMRARIELLLKQQKLTRQDIKNILQVCLSLGLSLISYIYIYYSSLFPQGWVWRLSDHMRVS